MKEQKFVFLVRTENGVGVTDKKPKGLDISADGDQWIFKRYPDQDPLVFCVGNSGDLLYTDGWEGPIGVYDLSDYRHVEAFLEQFRLHYNEVVSWKLQCELKRLFGEEALIAECYVIKPAIEQRRQPLTSLQQLYLSCRQMFYDMIGLANKKNLE